MAADDEWYMGRDPKTSPNSGDDRSSINSNLETVPPTPERVFAEQEDRAKKIDIPPNPSSAPRVRKKSSKA